MDQTPEIKNERKGTTKDAVATNASPEKRTQTEGAPDHPWDAFRVGVQDKWRDLKERDLEAYKGKGRHELVGFIGARTGQDRMLIDRDVDGLAQEAGYRFQ